MRLDPIGRDSFRRRAARRQTTRDDGQVTINELIASVDIALRSSPASLMKTCLPADANVDYRVTVEEPVFAIKRAMDGCK